MKIFIKGLPLQVEESELREVFGDFGQVKSLRIIKDRETGQSRGFGFVEMPNVAEAKEAIANMNGGDYYGNTIFVAEAKDDKGPEGGNNRGGGFNRGGGNRSGYSNNRY
ncbi:RNA recognition motif domain-containing protein [Pararcticibacter amylolyticus]|uniref:RNA-binding protein n=1 Tax=Pararcticibacter amylolyticus TaxID=2173175 RepID=A0A2U2PLB1_9SPHI|nr:RNA-binding protein [Pararcticibacter amylolyticus]PWG82197.1 RNA-binding protein [Pararcticibacter amylolyticus]